MRLFNFVLTCTFLTLACGGSGGTSMTDSSTGTAPGTTGETGADTGSSSTASPTSGGSGSESLSGTTSTTGDSTTTSATSDGSTTTDETTTSPVLSTSGVESTSDAESTSKGSTGEESTTGAIKDCMAWEAAFQSEILEVRGCMNDDECGVEMKGTSCGCTRNWVARLDADLAEFEALVETANELGCELPFVSTCDCPATDGFECAGGICNWNYL